jgi:putative thiamine transport system permease protein
MRPLAGALPLLLLWGLPLLLALMMLVPSLADGAAWTAMLAHPQAMGGLALSLFTGTLASLLALLFTVLLLAGLHGGKAWRWMQAASAAGLALPHLAFAIGFGFLVMPSGLIARLFVGGDTPPDWVSVQDPLGLSLTAALAIKEVPFLLTAGFAALSRGDMEQRMALQLRAAASLGHGKGSAWFRIVLPQLLHDLRWPLVIVFVYGATVVDMALVLGPTQPPTFAVVIWHALNDADPAVNRMGLAGTILLTAALGIVLALAFGILRALRGPLRVMLTDGPSALAAPRWTARIISSFGIGVFALALVLLFLLSFAPRWPYPALLPPTLGLSAWTSMETTPLWLSLALGVLAAFTALAMAVLWFETQLPSRDLWPIGLALASLALPQLAVAGGQYRLFLDAGLTGSLLGLFLAHLAPTAAYVLIVLTGPYRAFDARYIQAARALSVSQPSAWLKVKLPLLKAPLLTSAAIGFAVSMVQFVPAQLIAGGRFSTLPMEAVTLSSGGSRPLTAAFALLLALPPLLAVLTAAMLGRPRWR